MSHFPNEAAASTPLEKKNPGTPPRRIASCVDGTPNAASCNDSSSLSLISALALPQNSGATHCSRTMRPSNSTTSWNSFRFRPHDLRSSSCTPRLWAMNMSCWKSSLMVMLSDKRPVPLPCFAATLHTKLVKSRHVQEARRPCGGGNSSPSSLSVVLLNPRSRRSSVRGSALQWPSMLYWKCATRCVSSSSLHPKSWEKLPKWPSMAMRLPAATRPGTCASPKRMTFGHGASALQSTAEPTVSQSLFTNLTWTSSSRCL
mmetsp:Transcript_64362/g.179980  ORF Transcript_64362/g.179980 Transcript_64362/m.179980 type:complete len:259 (+) Transcript_64362:486-1262(+)